MKYVKYYLPLEGPVSLDLSVLTSRMSKVFLLLKKSGDLKNENSERNPWL